MLPPESRQASKLPSLGAEGMAVTEELGGNPALSGGVSTWLLAFPLPRERRHINTYHHQNAAVVFPPGSVGCGRSRHWGGRECAVGRGRWGEEMRDAVLPACLPLFSPWHLPLPFAVSPGTHIKAQHSTT